MKIAHYLAIAAAVLVAGVQAYLTAGGQPLVVGGVSVLTLLVSGVSLLTQSPLLPKPPSAP